VEWEEPKGLVESNAIQKDAEKVSPREEIRCRKSISGETPAAQPEPEMAAPWQLAQGIYVRTRRVGLRWLSIDNDGRGYENDANCGDGDTSKSMETGALRVIETSFAIKKKPVGPVSQPRVRYTKREDESISGKRICLRHEGIVCFKCPWKAHAPLQL